MTDSIIMPSTESPARGNSMISIFMATGKKPVDMHIYHVAEKFFGSGGEF